MMIPTFSAPRKTERRKNRRILIDIATVHNEIDSATYRKGDARYRESAPQFRNAIQSDASEGLDGMVMRRLTDWRDGRVRKILSWCLDTEFRYVADNIPKYRGKYIYALSLPRSFDDSMLEAGARLIDEYLVKGALSDWYEEAGVDDGRACKAELEELEEAIGSFFRTCHTRTPLQPFGPSERVSDDDFFYKPHLAPTTSYHGQDDPFGMPDHGHHHYHHSGESQGVAGPLGEDDEIIDDTMIPE